MTASATSTAWRLARRPEGALAKGDLELARIPLPALNEGELRVRTLYLSIDPTNRIWMSARKQYMPPVPLGEVMRGSTLGIVEESRAEGIPEGAHVVGSWGWQSHANLPATMVNPLPDPLPAPLPAFLNGLGFIGATAWFGMTDIVKVEPGTTLVVTAAAGAVGSIAAQIGRIRGARVIGIAGGEAKCRYLTETLGLDGAIDYRAEDVGAALDRLAPDGIDRGFENVGGPIFDAILDRLNNFARIALCGLIATYNEDDAAPGPQRFPMILMRRALVQGFIVSDYIPRFPEFMSEMAGWMAAGKITTREHIVDGLDRAPEALGMLFDGRNEGKLMVRITDA